MRKLWLISVGAQEKEIRKFCFNRCGKIIPAGVKFMGGTFGLCSKPNCPYEVDKLEAGECKLEDGSVVDATLRKLGENKK